MGFYLHNDIVYLCDRAEFLEGAAPGAPLVKLLFSSCAHLIKSGEVDNVQAEAMRQFPDARCARATARVRSFHFGSGDRAPDRLPKAASMDSQRGNRIRSRLPGRGSLADGDRAPASGHSRTSRFQAASYSVLMVFQTLSSTEVIADLRSILKSKRTL